MPVVVAAAWSMASAPSWTATDSASCLTKVPSSPISSASESVAARVLLSKVSSLLSMRGESAAELGDLAGEIGGAAGEFGDLVAGVGAVAETGGHDIVEREAGEGGQRHDRRLRAG